MPTRLTTGATDFDAEREDIAQRQKFADLLREQAIQVPQTQMAGNRAIPLSWAQGLAQAVKGGASGYIRDRAKMDQTALAEKRAQALSTALGGMPQPTQQTSVQSTDQQGTGSFDMNGMAGPPVQTQTVSPTMQQNAAWLGSLGKIGPDAVAIGTHALGFQEKKDAAAAAQAQAQALQSNLLADRAMGRDQAEQTRRDLAADADRRARELAQMNIDSRHDLKTMIAGNQPVTSVTIQDPKDPNGTLVIDGRSGKVFGKGPKLTDAGKLENKRSFNMQGLGATIQEADDLLTGKSGKDLPTGSTIGNMVDTAAGVFGASPAGAKEAETLKAIGGALVSKMPRMEGPQSDKDVALYKEMAGRIADATVPRDRRLAALEKVKELWGKYERPSVSTTPGAPSVPGQPRVVDW